MRNIQRFDFEHEVYGMRRKETNFLAAFAVIIISGFFLYMAASMAMGLLTLRNF